MHTAAFFGPKFALSMHLGGISHLLFVLGVILFVVWAIKNLSKEKLKKVWIVFLIIGVVGSFAFSGGSRFKKGFTCDGADKSSVMQEAMIEQGFDVSDEQMEAMMEKMKEEMGGMHGRWLKK